jgi:LmbE family N-acetylglucosaminyl deacetylase
VSGPGRSVALSREQIARFRERSLVVISPHFDDACFSLGCFLEEVGRGALVNVFTRGTHLPTDQAKHLKDAEAAFAIRDSEDRAFAERCGLTRHDLESEEPSLRGRRPLDLSHVSDDVARIETKLLDALDALAPMQVATKASLFTPMGLGRHVNHRAIADVVARNAARLRERYEVFLYEDLPYAHLPLERSAGLARARAALGSLCTRHTLAVAWNRKRSLVALYESQFRHAPRWINFRPAAARPLSLHEAFWSTE